LRKGENEFDNREAIIVAPGKGKQQPQNAGKEKDNPKKPAVFVASRVNVL
jgi:hypothetical protein